MSKKRVTVPPGLAAFVGPDELTGLDPVQLQAVLDLLGTGDMSPEEASTELRYLSEGTFLCKYLGSVPVAAARLSAAMWEMFGEQAISTAGPRIKALKQKAVDVVLSFTTNGIRVADGAELIQSEAFDNVVYAGQDATDKKRFAYMTHYTRLGIIFCHVFSMKKGAETETVASSINALMLARGKPPVDKFAAHEKTTGQTLGIFELGFVGEVGLRHFKETVAMTTAEEAMLKKQLADASLVVLVVSSEGIRIVEQASRDILAMVWLQDITPTQQPLISSGGPLDGTLLLHRVQLQYSEQLHFARQLSSALGFVAANRFVHLDVASRNNVLKLGDFGLAHAYDRGKKHWVMRKASSMSIRWLCVEIMGPPPKIVGEGTAL
eukprot:gene1061-21457_t